MRWWTTKITLTWDWEDIIVKDQNNWEIFYWWIMVFFWNNLYIRWENWQEEILLTPDLSPLELVWQPNSWFPYQVKWIWDLKIMTLN